LSSPPLHYSVVAAAATAGVGTDSMEALHFYDENIPAWLPDRCAPVRLVEWSTRLKHIALGTFGPSDQHVPITG